MILLALEFSSRRRSVALFREANGDAPGELLAQASETGGRPARPLTLVEAVLHESGIDRAAVEGVVVGLGPGSYTGIRSSIALAQGWQLARRVRLAGVSTADCLAVQARALGWFGDVTIIIDAQRNEHYLVTYRISPEGFEVRRPLRLASAAEVRLELDSGTEWLVGPEVEKLSPRARVLLPEAQALPPCLAPGWKDTPGEKLEPIYLREVSFVKAPPLRIFPA